jgi:hypothetical protein
VLGPHFDYAVDYIDTRRNADIGRNHTKDRQKTPNILPLKKGGSPHFSLKNKRGGKQYKNIEKMGGCF